MSDGEDYPGRHYPPPVSVPSVYDSLSSRECSLLRAGRRTGRADSSAHSPVTEMVSGLGRQMKMCSRILRCRLNSIFSTYLDSPSAHTADLFRLSSFITSRLPTLHRTKDVSFKQLLFLTAGPSAAHNSASGLPASPNSVGAGH